MLLWRCVVIGSVIRLFFDVAGEEVVAALDFCLRFLFFFELEISFPEGCLVDSKTVAQGFLSVLLDDADHLEDSVLGLLK